MKSIFTFCFLPSFVSVKFTNLCDHKYRIQIPTLPTNGNATNLFILTINTQRKICLYKFNQQGKNPSVLLGILIINTINRNSRKKHHVMRFNSVLNVDFAKWGQVKMERENNQKEFARPEDEMPK